jgi:hypothetical protein
VIEAVAGNFKRYYLIFLLPVTFFSILLLVLNFSLIQVAIFSFFYLWNLVLHTKSLREQFLQKKMRFSFIRQLLNVDIIMLKLVRINIISKLIQVSIFTIIIYFLFENNSFVFVIPGATCLELVKLIQKKVANS